MQAIRIHRRSRLRIILADIACMVACWLVALAVVYASDFNCLAAVFCTSIAIACSILYGRGIAVVCCNGIGFELLLTTTKIVCHSPDQRLCPDFDVELKDIDMLTTDSDGWSNLVTCSGTEVRLSLARNFGAPVRRFANDIITQAPHLNLRAE